MTEEHFKKIISHSKEFGFIFPSSEIYDGLSATYDYGQNGVELKNNIKKYWWHSMVQMHENIVGIDARILRIFVFNPSYLYGLAGTDSLIIYGLVFLRLRIVISVYRLIRV